MNAAVDADTQLSQDRYVSPSVSVSSACSAVLVFAPPPTYTEQSVSYPSHASDSPGFTSSE